MRFSWLVALVLVSPLSLLQTGNAGVEAGVLARTERSSCFLSGPLCLSLRSGSKEAALFCSRKLHLPVALSRRNEVRYHAVSTSLSLAGSEAFSETRNNTTKSLPFTLRRARPHELDLLAILSTEAFTPRGEWYDVVQKIKFQAICFDLQSQFYQRFYHWKDVVRSFKPPIYESRYALLAAAKPNGNAVGVTELCIAPSPMAKEVLEEMGLPADGNSPYLSNLAVDLAYRRNGVGQALVKWCEDLSLEWGHNILSLHVEESNVVALSFYRRLGFVEAKKNLEWYNRIGRTDLLEQRQLLLVKVLATDHVPKAVESEQSPSNTS